MANPVPVKPRSVDPTIVASSFLYTPPAFAAAGTVDVNMAFNPATGQVTLTATPLGTGPGTLAPAPGFSAENAIGRLRANYNVNLRITSAPNVNQGFSFSNACCLVSGQLNFRVTSLAAAASPAQMSFMITQA